MITEFDNICAICGRPAECKHHLLFGNFGSIRKLADADNIVIPMCNKCHNMGRQHESIHGNPMAEDLSKIAGQLLWEKEYIEKLTDGDLGKEARIKFMQRYGRSYL